MCITILLFCPDGETLTEGCEEMTEDARVSVQLIAMHLSLAAFSVNLLQGLNEGDAGAQSKTLKGK